MLLVVGIALLVLASAHAMFAFFALHQETTRNPVRFWGGILALTTCAYAFFVAASYFANYFGRDYSLTYRLAWTGYMAIGPIYRIVIYQGDWQKTWRIWVARFFDLFWVVAT